MIPKIIHQFWTGDMSKLPKAQMETWKEKNPDFTHILWDEDMVRSLNHPLMKMYDICKVDMASTGDVVRNIVLDKFGGIYIDADAEALNPIPDHMLNHDSFACYENEWCRGQLIAGGFLAAQKDSLYLYKLSNLMLSYKEKRLQFRAIEKRAWEYTGPLAMTYVWKKYHCRELFLYPSNYFIPTHYNDLVSVENEDKGVIGKHDWSKDKYTYQEQNIEFQLSNNPIIWDKCSLIEELLSD